MRIRKHSRITALILALVMILPLISIPTFAEDTVAPTPINFSQNFDSATQNSDVLSAWGKNSKVENGAVLIPAAGYEDGTVYVNKNKSDGGYVAATGNATAGYKATVDGVEYIVKGTVNNTAPGKYVAATSVTKPDGTAATLPSGTTLYLATAAAKDLHAGFSHIAQGTYIKTPAVKAADGYTRATFTADVVIPTDLTNNDAAEICYYAANGTRLNLLMVKRMMDKVEVYNHGDTANTAGGATIRVPAGKAFELKIISDLVKGVCYVYVDNHLCRINTAQATAIKTGLQENGFMVQFRRGQGVAPTAAKGAISVDNVTLTTAAADTHFGTMDFEEYDGVTAFSEHNATLTSVTATGYGSNFGITPPTTLTTVTENGNTFLKHGFDIEETMKAESYYLATGGNNDEDDDGLVDYFAYTTTKKPWVDRANISSYDSSTKKLTMTDGTTYAVAPANSANIAKGLYGTFIYKSEVYNLCTPAYAGASETATYYAYVTPGRWDKNEEIKSYEGTTLTMTDGTTYTVTSASSDDIAKGKYGTFTYDGLTYMLTTPNYAVKNVFKGVNGVMNKNVAVRLPYVTHEEYDKVVLSAKHYIAPGSYGVSQSQLYSIMKNNTATGYQGFYNITMRTTDAYIPEVTGLNGTVFLPMGDWFDLDIVIDLKNGACEFYVDNVYVGNLTKALGTNIEFEKSANSYGGSSWIIGKMYDGSDYNLSAKGYIGYDDVSLRPVSTMAQTYLAKEDFDSPYALGKEPKYAASGIPSISDCLVAESVVTDEVGSPAWKIKFDRNNKAYTGHTTHGYNVDKSSTVKHPASSVLKGDTVVFEASYFIDSNARGQIQSQLKNITVDPAIPDLDGSKYKYEVATDATENPTNFKRKNTATWADLYVIKFYQDASNSEIVLTRESGTRYNPNASVPLRAEVWNTITAVLTRSTGMVKYYVNGEFAFEDQLNSATGAAVSQTKNNEAYKNVGFAANQWVVGKVNKAGTSGTFYIDDLKMYEGTAPTVTPEVDTDRVYDFEEFKYVNDGDSAVFGGFTSAPQLLTFKKEANGNTALRLDMGPYLAHNRWVLYRTDNYIRGLDVAYTDGATQLSFEGTNYNILKDEANDLPYIEITEKDKKVTKNYIVPGDWAETAAGYSRGNVAVATSFAHDTFSHETTPTVVFAADYLIEAGSTGIIESQFSNATGVKKDETERSSTGFLQLFHLYTNNGLIDGQGGKNYGYNVKVGEWINIKVVANLVTGVFNIYADGILVRTYDCGYTNLELTQDWSFAKVKRADDDIGNTKENFKGGVLIDKVSIGVEKFEHSEKYGDKFLTDEVFEGYTADLITIVESASIRFKVPCGLRFASVVNTQKLNHLKALFPEATVKMGTFIAPSVYVIPEAGFDTYERLTRTDFADNAYLDVEFGGEYFRGDAGVTLEAGKSYMTGSIVGIKVSNYDRDFAAVGYIEFVLEEKNDMDEVISSEIIGACYTDAVIRNVQEVAETVLDEADLTSEQEDILYKYLDFEELLPEYMPDEAQ